MTIVDIDLQHFFLQKGLMTGWVSMSSETCIQYTDPTTGEIISEKAIGIQILNNSQKEFQDASFDTKYQFLDFGSSQVYAMFKLIFPPIARGVNKISINENAGRKGFYWNNINIETVEYETNFEEAKKNIEEHIAKSKSKYAGEYKGIEAYWQLAFIQEDDNYVLVNMDAKQPGWNIGDIWADHDGFHLLDHQNAEGAGGFPGRRLPCRKRRCDAGTSSESAGIVLYDGRIFWRLPRCGFCSRIRHITAVHPSRD